MKQLILLTMALSVLAFGLLAAAQGKKGNENQQQTVNENQQSKKDSAEVLVKFKPNTKEDQIKAMATEIGMLQVKQIKELRLRVFKVTANKKVDEVIRECEKKPFVEYAEANKKVTTKK